MLREISNHACQRTGLKNFHLFKPDLPNMNGLASLLASVNVGWSSTDLIKCEGICAAEKLKAHIFWLMQLALVKLRIPVSERVQDHQKRIILWHHSGKDMRKRSLTPQLFKMMYSFSVTPPAACLLWNWLWSFSGIASDELALKIIYH